MKRFLVFLVCIFLGIGIGYYFGQTRPALKNQERILAEYHQIRNGLGLSDQEMAEMGKRVPEMLEQIKRSEEFAAAIAFRVFKQLEKGEIEGAKKNLATTVSIYYRGHREDGHTNLILNIEKFAATNAAISNAIHRPLE